MRERTKSELADILTRQDGMPLVAIDEVTRALAANPMSVNAGSDAALGIGLLTSGVLPIVTGSAVDLLNN